MPTKQDTQEQHEKLHEHWPNNCCLCKLENKLIYYQNRVNCLEAENTKLKRRLARHTATKKALQLIDDNDYDILNINGTGKNGKITKKDVLNYNKVSDVIDDDIPF